MDIGTFNGIWTAVLIIAFMGIVVWAYSANRKKDFDKMANLPLEDDSNGTENRS